MIELPQNFESDIQGQNLNLYPIVDITGVANISTKNVTLSGTHYKPLLLNIPSIKESMDFEDRKYKISNVTLRISNYEYNGERFSDYVGNLINARVVISWVSQSESILEVYKGIVRRYTHDDKTVNLSIEDSTQRDFHADVPKEFLPDVNSVPLRYRNKRVPMVYGDVYGSPCVIKSNNISDTSGQGGVVIACDNKPIKEEQAVNSLLIYRGDLYWEMFPEMLHSLSGNIYQEDHQYELTGNEIHVKSIINSSDNINLIANNAIQGINRNQTEGIAKYKSFGDTEYYGDLDDVIKMIDGDLSTYGTISGTVWRVGTPDVSSPGAWGGAEDVSRQFIALYAKYPQLPIQDIFSIPGVNGNEVPSKVVTEYTPKIEVTASIVGTGDASLRLWTGTNLYLISNDETLLIYETIQITNTHPPDRFNITFDTTGQSVPIDVDAKIYNLQVDTIIDLNKFMESDFYADIKGRTIGNSIYDNPANIIWHIIKDEVGFPGEADSSYIDAGNYLELTLGGWKLAFSVFKKINSKKLIEEISRESRMFPFIKGDKLAFNFVKDAYVEDDEDFQIKDSDVIRFKFGRSKIEDVKTKVILSYHLDYASDDFKKTTISNTEPDTAAEFFTVIGDGYSNDYYGIEGEQGDEPIELKYIRDDETAEKLQRFLLAWYCNQHNTCKVRLPLSYLFAEAGDIITFPTLLNGKKAYGEDYSLEGRFLSGATIRNGQEIFPYWMIKGVSKTLKYVELDLIQMHNLVDDITNVAPIANAGTDQVGFENATITLDGTESYDVDEDELTYAWTGTTPLSGANTATPSFSISLNEPVTHTFELIVNDGEFDSLPDSCYVFVNPVWQAVRGIFAVGFEFFQLWWANNGPYPGGTNGFYAFGELWRSSAAAAGHGIIISNPNNSNWRWDVVGGEGDSVPNWFNVWRSQGDGNAVPLGVRNTNFENDYSGYGHLIITLDEHSYSPADPDSLWPRTITFYLEDENTLTKRYFVYLQQPYDGYADYGPGFDKQGVQELIGTSDLTKEGEPSGVS